MATIKRILKGDTVKIISGSKKGTTGKVLSVLTKKNAVLVEGIGNIHRKVKPTQQNPRGGQRYRRRSFQALRRASRRPSCG